MEKMDIDNSMVLSALESAMRDIIIGNYDEYGIGFNVYPIEHRSLDGYIPHTNGGYRLILSSDLSAFHSSGMRFNDESLNVELDKLIAVSQDIAIDKWVEENESDLRGILKLSSDECLSDFRDNIFEVMEYDTHAELYEKLWEIENRYLSESSEIFIELRAHYYSADNIRNSGYSFNSYYSDSSVDIRARGEVWFCAGVNFDLGYGRDKGLEISGEYLIPTHKLTPGRALVIAHHLAETI